MKKIYDKHILPFVNWLLNLRVQDILVAAFVIIFFLGLTGIVVFSEDGWFHNSRLFFWLRSIKVIKVSFRWIKIGFYLSIIGGAILFCCSYVTKRINEKVIEDGLYAAIILCASIGFYIGIRSEGGLGILLGILSFIFPPTFLFIIINNRKN